MDCIYIVLFQCFDYSECFYSTHQNSLVHTHTHIHTLTARLHLYKVPTCSSESHTYHQTAISSNRGLSVFPKDTQTCRLEEPGWICRWPAHCTELQPPKSCKAMACWPSLNRLFHTPNNLSVPYFFLTIIQFLFANDSWQSCQTWTDECEMSVAVNMKHYWWSM